MSLDDHLRQFAGKDVTVLLNPGNAGDGLIHLGARELFGNLGLRFREKLFPTKLAGEVLLIHGCGGFGGVSAHRVAQSRHYFERFEEIVILPSSFDTGRPEVQEFLQTVPDHVTVYAREKVSFDLAAACIADAGRLKLSQDLALRYDYTSWKARAGSGTLAAFRTDAEAALEVSGICSIDVSRYGDKYDAWPLLDVVSRFETVHTDRMHVGVAAAMMGKQTFLYDNSYHKIRAVYEHSLVGLAHVTYMGARVPEVELSAQDRRRMKILDISMRARKPLLRAVQYLPRKKFRR